MEENNLAFLSCQNCFPHHLKHAAIIEAALLQTRKVATPNPIIIANEIFMIAAALTKKQLECKKEAKELGLIDNKWREEK